MVLNYLRSVFQIKFARDKDASVLIKSEGIRKLPGAQSCNLVGHVCLVIHLYIYIYTQREREKRSRSAKIGDWPLTP